MYDRVSGQLFRNAGTGAFTIGPDKTAWTNPYVTNGLVAMWDGEWNAGGGVHDPNATSWVDLVGDTSYSIPNGMTNDGNAYRSNYCSAARLNLPSLTSFSIEACLKLNAFSANDSRIIVSDKGVQSFFATVSGGGLLSCATTNGSDASFTFSGDARFVSRTCSCTVGSEAKIYCDGKQKGNAVSYLPQTPTYYNFPGSSAVDVSLYCFRIYSRALTAAEIAHNYAVDKERFNLP